MLYVVHCVDTEGPLAEPLNATFERLRSIYDIDLPESKETLAALQKGTYDLGDKALEKAIAKTFDPRNLAYMQNWEQLEDMLDRFDREEERLRVPDSTGRGWVANWHCMSHAGFDADKNPRGRDLEMHAVFDRYRKRCETNGWGDAVHWHFHPVPRTRQANHSATAYFTNPTLYEVISRRVLERLWFPCVNRPGFHSERPDSHWFLEQWMPFDMANCNSDQESDQADLNHGRFSDWREAPKDWVVYHPHHDNYQLEGNCRRAIARCLYLGGRFNCLSGGEVDRAFAAARERDVVMAFCNHDFRDLTLEAAEMQKMLAAAQAQFPDVHWQYSDACTAMRKAMKLEEGSHVNISLALQEIATDYHQLHIKLDRDPFGPQPWLCYKTRDGHVHYDNLDRGLHKNEWYFCMDEQTACVKDVHSIGVATNTAEGKTTVSVMDLQSRKISTQKWN